MVTYVYIGRLNSSNDLLMYGLFVKAEHPMAKKERHLRIGKDFRFYIRKPEIISAVFYVTSMELLIKLHTKQQQ